MTDEQIISALEWCEHFENNLVLSGRIGEKFTLALQALQTIRQVLKDFNRQKAENEKKNTEIDILIEKKDTLQDENSELMAEVERLKEEIKDLKREMSYAVYPNTIGDKHEMGCW